VGARKRGHFRFAFTSTPEAIQRAKLMSAMLTFGAAPQIKLAASFVICRHQRTGISERLQSRTKSGRAAVAYASRN